jgi:hypothetical protein
MLPSMNATTALHILEGAFLTALLLSTYAAWMYLRGRR